MKQAALWQSLYGEFILTIQADTWIVNMEPYTIDYFMKLNKSYIGGNMNHVWRELKRENLVFNFRNFNGGLSLRKRLDMINIINTFPPTLTTDNDKKNVNLNVYAEDVYFTIGCYKLGLSIGDDESSSHFAMHTIEKKKYFGVHNPKKQFSKQLNLQYPHLKYLNKYLNL